MLRVLIISLILLLGAISAYWMLSGGSSSDSAPETYFTDPQTSPVPFPQETTIIPETTKITSFSGELYDADFLVSDQNTEKISENYYWNTLEEEYYVIGYVEDQGLITVMLLNQNLALSRELAETQLKNVLPYSEQELCEMNIKVYTNENVVPEYTGELFGLSFCPFSAELN